jgi:alpha 1,2-mannosyltransferase
MTTFNSDGIRRIDFSLYKTDIARLKKSWKQFVKEEVPSYPKDDFEGRGIIICAGGLCHFTCCWIAIKVLRQWGCQLPIQVWYIGNELSPEVIRELEAMDVECVNSMEYDADIQAGWALKPLSIIKSRFREVLSLDADNICTRNPSFLFDSDEYKQSGAVFWPDYWTTAQSNPIWSIVGSDAFDTKEQESGQILIDKERCWQALHLCLYFNRKRSVYYKLLWGDKDTFRFAWLALRTPFHMIQQAPGACGYVEPLTDRFIGTTMMQHDMKGAPLFMHKVLLKWDSMQTGERAWVMVKKFYDNAVNKEYIFLPDSKKGHRYMDLDGDVELSPCEASLPALEEQCLQYLHELRESRFYAEYMMYTHLGNQRYPDKSILFTV